MFLVFGTSHYLFSNFNSNCYISNHLAAKKNYQLQNIDPDLNTFEQCQNDDTLFDFKSKCGHRNNISPVIQIYVMRKIY